MDVVSGRVASLIDLLRPEPERRRPELVLREEVEVVERLQEVAMAFATEHDEARLVQRITDEATALCGAAVGAFFFNDRNDTGDSYRLFALSGARTQDFAALPMPRATPLFQPTFRGERIVRSGDVREDPMFGQWGGLPPGHPPIVSYMAAPVKSRRGEVLGALFFGHPEPRRFTEQHEHVIAALAAHAAVALENARLYAQLQRSERAAREAHLRAEEASRRKDEFLAILGHELRNPLAPIMTALELLRRKGSEAQARELEIVERQSHHLLRLVDDLMDLSRITRGKVDLQLKQVDLAGVVATAIEETSSLIEERGHRLEVAIPEGMTIEADEDRLVQVFANLLSNAARYTDAGGHVCVGAARAGERVRAWVRDDGRGMEPDTVDHLFEMFAQGRRPLDRSEGGLGLGLTLVRSLVELHGGQVTAYSDGPGCGSELRLELPVNGRAELESDMVVAEATPQTCRILLVDDNVDALELLQSALGDLGFEVHTAADGGRGLDLAHSVRPHAAVLDIGLPVMDGYELARRLRRVPDLEGLRLVALTGYGQDNDRERALAAGFDEHLVKPTDVDTLVRALRSDD